MATLTVSVPENMIELANHLAMAVGHSSADGLTYGDHLMQDGEGNIYAVSSFDNSLLSQPPMETLSAPSWDTDKVTNMTLAAQAQAALVVWPPMGDEEPGPLPEAQPDKITVIVGPNGIEALGMMGLRVVDYE